MALDPLHLAGSLNVALVCRLDDPCLPSVPPLSVVVPHDYPRTPPTCPADQHQYGCRIGYPSIRRSSTVYFSIIFFACRAQT